MIGPKPAIIAVYADDVTGMLMQCPWMADEAHWICLSLDAYDSCLTRSVRSFELPAWLQQVSTFCPNRHRGYTAALKGLDEDAIRERQALGFNDRASWNHRHHLFLLTALGGIKVVAHLASQHLTGHFRFVLPQRSNASDYHYPGGLSSAILAQAMRAAGLPVECVLLPQHHLKQAYSPEVYDRIPNFWSADVLSRWRTADRGALISPSGLFNSQDQIKLKILIQTLSLEVEPWTIAPAFWNVIPDGSAWGQRMAMLDAFAGLDPGTRHGVVCIVESMTRSTNAAFAELLGEDIAKLDIFDQQIGRLKQRYFYQAMMFMGLTQLQVHRPARSVVLSNLDGGLNGPLFSVSEEFGIPCFALPHSLVVNLPTEGTATVMTEYWQPRASTSFDGRPNPTVHVALDPPANPRPKHRETQGPRLTVLFNGIHRGAHTTTSIRFVRETVFEIQRLCVKHGAELVYRLKPGDQTPIRAYSELLKLDPTSLERTLKEPLDAVLCNSDLVVAIDDPSSAVWRAIELGCAAVLVADRPFIDSTLIDDDIFTERSSRDGIALIDRLLGDQNELDRLRHQQVRRMQSRREERLTEA